MTLVLNSAITISQYQVMSELDAITHLALSKKVFISKIRLSLYRSPNQSKDECDKFIENLELTFDTCYKNNSEVLRFCSEVL